MSVINRLPDIIASAAGSLFQEYTLRRFNGRTSDGRGGFTTSWETYTAKGQVTDFSDELRYLRSIPEDARLLILQGKDIPHTPKAEDYVAIDGASWKIIKVETVPSNAIYECEVHPDTSDWGLDLATTVTATPDLLASLEDTVANVGNLIFEDLQYFYSQSNAADGRGGNVRVLGAIDCRGIVTEYSDRLRAVMGIAEQDRMVIIQGQGLNIEPSPGDVVRYQSQYFVLTNVKTVPGKAVYEARGRPTTEDAAELPAITADGVGVAIFFSSSVGEFVKIDADASAQMDDFTGSAFGQFVIVADASVQMDSFTATSEGQLTKQGESASTMEDFTSSGDATLPITADATAQLISAFSVESIAQQTITATAGSPLDDFISAATAEARIEADASASLDDFTSTASAGSDNQGNANVTLDAFTSAAEGEPLLTGDQTTQLVSFTGSATGEPALEADASATLDAFTSVADAELSIEGVHAAAVDDFVGASAGGQGDLEATAAATLQDFTGSSEATIRNFASASAILDDFVGTAIGEAVLEGQHGGIMDDFTGSADATLPIEADASPVLDNFTGASDGTLTETSPLRAETTALLNEMVNTQTVDRQTAIDDLMAVMVDEGIFALLDWFCIIGADDDACLRNWIQPTKLLAQTNNAQIVHDSYYDTESDPSGNGAFVAEAVSLTGATLGNLTFGNYFVKLDESGSTRASRIRDNKTWFRCDFSAPFGRVTEVTFANNYTNRVVNDPYHMVMVHRGTGGGDREFYYNGVSVQTKTGSGGSLDTSSIIDLIGTASKDSDERILCAYFGQALSTAQVLSLYNAVEAYKTAIGA